MHSHANHTIHRDHTHHGWNNAFKPVLKIAPGETVQFETKDASSGQLDNKSTAEALKKLDLAFVNPVTGPVYIDGAKPGDGSFASNCLLARRLAERGVRFIQLYHRDWDHHNDVKNNIVFKEEEVDKPTAALITDLKQHGMLDDTLVIWGGEFGRTPFNEKGKGRDHNPWGFTIWMAGGGIKGGQYVGTTD